MQETVSLLDGLKDFLSKNSDLNSFKEELIVIAQNKVNIIKKRLVIKSA